jgi:hypothetical protein
MERERERMSGRVVEELKQRKYFGEWRKTLYFWGYKEHLLASTQAMPARLCGRDIMRMKYVRVVSTKRL